MDANTRRQIIAAMNAERVAAEQALENIRRLKAQILLDEEMAARRVNDSIRRHALIRSLVDTE